MDNMQRKNNNAILASYEEAQELSSRYDVPLTDILVMGMNLEGVDCSSVQSDRTRFSMRPLDENEPFYFALTNTSNSRWVHDKSSVWFGDVLIGPVGDGEEDTCDSTYFRRYTDVEGVIRGTELTINSNSRSNCSGCRFCGTYNLTPEDADGKDLTTPDKLRMKLESICESEGVTDLGHLSEVGVVTGCFPDEETTVDHLRMVSDVLRDEYSFTGELKYVGSQVTSGWAIDTLAQEASPFGLSLTVECFTRREQMLKPSKRVPLDEGRDVLSHAKDKGMNTTILYIIGLDSLESFKEEIGKYADVVTKLPVINTMQEYIPGQWKLRDDEAHSMEYFLEARKAVEDAFLPTGLTPNVWENYRGLFFTEYGGQKLDGIRI